MEGIDGGRISTGVSGLDRVVSGGLLPERAYLVRGGPGSGKTTLGMQFLTAQPGEPALFVTMGEHVDQLRTDAENQGFDLSAVEFLDLTPARGETTELESYELMAPAEAEVNPIGERIGERFVATRHRRVFIDSLSHLSYLAPDAFQYRKQVMGLLRFLTRQGATVLSAAEIVAEPADADELQFLADGIIDLSWRGDRRVLSVTKYRGSGYVGGLHTIRLDGSGMTCYPRLEPGEHQRGHHRDVLATGVSELDRLLKGGITKGTVTVISGPTGVGKTTLGLQFLKSAAERGERSVLYTFEENDQTLRFRAESTSLDFAELETDDRFAVHPIEPLTYSADEFAEKLRHEVEHQGARMVMIDSLSGFRLSVAGDDMVQRILALCRYLTNMGVTVLVVNEVANIAGENVQVTEQGVSFLADAVIMLRYLEFNGELHKAIGVLKKRTGNFEKTLREFGITEEGISVGKPLTRLRGILRGFPEFVERPVDNDD